MHRSVVPVVALVLVLTSLSAFAVSTRIAAPSDGTVINNADVLLTNGRVILREGRADGLLRKDDELVAVAGHDVREWLSHGVGGLPVAVGDSVSYTVIRNGHRVDTNVVLGRFDMASALLRHWALMLLVALLIGTSVFVFSLRPGNPAALAGLITSLFAAASSVTNGIVDLQALDLVAGNQFWRWWFAELAAGPILGGMLHLALVFPEPNVLRRPKLSAVLAYGGPTLLYLLTVAVGLPITDTALGRLEVLGQPLWLVQFVYTPLIAVLLINNYRTARDQLTRRRLRWLAIALGGGQGLYFLLWVLPHQLTGATPLDWSFVHLVFIPVPIALAAAILRYRALDLDIVLSRSLLYVTLSLGVIGIYLAVVSLLNGLMQPSAGAWEQVLAAAVVVLLVHPLRIRLQTAINQWLFGDRDDPYRVVSTLASKLETNTLPTSMLHAVVETVGTALRLPYVAIENGIDATVSYGTLSGELYRFPLTYQGQQVGNLVVASRTPRESLRRPDRRALTQIARHAGASVYAARVTMDLERSRDRVLLAREEERRRLLHDLHDGVGPTLAAVALGLSIAGDSVDADPASARLLLGQLSDELQGAIKEIRRVAADLQPTALTRLGLVKAIQEHANTLQGRASTKIVIDASEQLPPLPSAVEVAAYRIACEALTNVARHAQARHCEVRLRLDTELCLEITDDGTGLVEGARHGVGLDSMVQRAAELGGDCVVEQTGTGGTRVRVRLPVNAH